MNEGKVKAYMREEIKEHVDLDTGEVNCTTLAEDAAQHFDAYGPPPSYDIPAEYYDWAFEVIKEYEDSCEEQASYAHTEVNK